MITYSWFSFCSFPFAMNDAFVSLVNPIFQGIRQLQGLYSESSLYKIPIYKSQKQTVYYPVIHLQKDVKSKKQKEENWTLLYLYILHRTDLTEYTGGILYGVS